MNTRKEKGNAGAEQPVHAYDRMLQRAERMLGQAAANSGPVLVRALDAAREEAIGLGELTREEADRVYHFISRDLYDAGKHMAEGEREIADWLRLGLLVAERDVLNRFSSLAKTAKLEIRHLEKARRRYDVWHTGEVTTIGTLCCKNCDELIHFERTGHIPPCPKCHATVFERVRE